MIGAPDDGEGRSVLSDLDLWRAARIMVKRYGDGAATEAAIRADEFLDQGNLDRQRLWMRIMQTIEELQRERPRTGRRCIEGTHKTAPVRCALT